ncbi:MAG TPA: FecR family protein [Mucilaginibacter sp.]|jgi:transmembrane sensor|nr:FecR family protein [Mucilaginibacter sp.]
MPDSLKKELLDIVKRYLNGEASEDEVNILEKYYHHFSDEPDVLEQFTANELNELDRYLKSRIELHIAKLEKPVIPIYRNRYLQIAAAMLLSLMPFLWYAHIKQNQPVITNQNTKHDFAPGINKAILTLANGSTIVLNNVKNGTVSRQSNINVIKMGNQLSYRSTDEKNGVVAYNTVTIPRGGKYQQIILADGTRVWLNTASSLRFPTFFGGKERDVELTGEAYFEVAKNKKKPFNVITANQHIKVLGTHFNVNAYADESVTKTTLLEGSVKLYSGDKSIRIAPGQQSVLEVQKGFKINNGLDLDEVMAWKNDMFQFDEADIQTIMRQVGRWYDVDVVFNGPISTRTYHGRISRNSNSSEVLKILELSGVNFTIEGRKIVVKQ